jgi:hypothetical protein
MGDSAKIQRNLREAMKEALRIQDRFVAKPVFAKTGRGYLKSEGVSTMQRSKLRCHFGGRWKFVGAATSSLLSASIMEILSRR